MKKNIYPRVNRVWQKKNDRICERLFCPLICTPRRVWIKPARAASSSCTCFEFQSTIMSSKSTANTFFYHQSTGHFPVPFTAIKISPKKHTTTTKINPILIHLPGKVPSIAFFTVLVYLVPLLLNLPNTILLIVFILISSLKLYLMLIFFFSKNKCYLIIEIRRWWMVFV